jgi:hypothetical protein
MNTPTSRGHASQRLFVVVPLAAVVAVLAAVASPVQAQAAYQPGQRVECDTTGSGKWWGPGTVQPFQKGDFAAGQAPDGSWYRFKADSNGVEYPCKPAFMRPLSGAAARPAGNAPAPAAPAAPMAQGTAPAATGLRAAAQTVAASANDILDCPVTQKPVKNGARPDAELFKKLVRCKKGEKAVGAGEEGAVRVEVTALQIGDARPWSYRQDIGNGQTETRVYPAKATYTVKTFYRAATEIEENWIRVMNFYVNAFGEWQIGSEEPVKAGAARRVAR